MSCLDTGRINPHTSDVTSRLYQGVMRMLHWHMPNIWPSKKHDTAYHLLCNLICQNMPYIARVINVGSTMKAIGSDYLPSSALRRIIITIYNLPHLEREQTKLTKFAIKASDKRNYLLRASSMNSKEVSGRGIVHDVIEPNFWIFSL